MTSTTVAAFALTAAVAALSPGPAVFLSLRNGVAFGIRAVAWSALGNITGLCALSLISILGLGVLLASSVILFNAVKIFGAAYLIYLGIRHLTMPSAASTAISEESACAISPLALFSEGLLIAITNPKAILFCTALFPQFVDPRASIAPQFSILVVVYMAISYTTQLSYALVASRARATLENPKHRRRFMQSLGVLFVAMGLNLLKLRRIAN